MLFLDMLFIIVAYCGIMLVVLVISGLSKATMALINYCSKSFKNLKKG